MYVQYRKEGLTRENGRSRGMGKQFIIRGNAVGVSSQVKVEPAAAAVVEQEHQQVQWKKVKAATPLFQ